MKYILALTLSFLLSCTSSDDSTSTGSGTSYSGPGSRYTITITDSTARIVEADSGLDVTGNITALSSGFSQIEISTVTNNGGMGVSVGDKVFALIIPGLVTIMKPITGTQIITAVPAGSCPTGDLSLRWISTKLSDPSTEDLYGNFVYNYAADSAQVTGFLAGNSTTTPDVDNTLTGLNCSAGIASPTTATMYLTPSGGAIVNLTATTPNRFVVALPAATMTSGGLDGNYAGVLFAENSGSTYAAHATVSGTGISVDSINPETGTADGAVDDNVTLSSFNYNSAGFMAGTLTGGEEIRCMGNTNINSSGKNFIFCVGQDPGGAATDVFVALFVSR